MFMGIYDGAEMSNSLNRCDNYISEYEHRIGDVMSEIMDSPLLVIGSGTFKIRS